jgi:glycyl-tRNA synthetase beta chain
LISANKRIANILKKNNFIDNIDIDKNLLDLKVELTLFEILNDTKDKIEPMLKKQKYTEILNELTKLHKPIDQFFDEVMVMVDEKAIRNNRLALLRELRYQFLNVADISRLSTI